VLRGPSGQVIPTPPAAAPTLDEVRAEREADPGALIAPALFHSPPGFVMMAAGEREDDE